MAGRERGEERETRAIRWPGGAAPGAAVLAALLASACTRSNNLLLGRVRAEVGGHAVVVTDCYRLRAPGPESDGPAGYRYAPCKDAVVSIRADTLTVNGRSYGRLAPGAGVLVDHGEVSVGTP